MKKYNLMQMPLLSFFSKRLYRDVGYNWKGANLAYLFLLLAICCLPATLHVRENMLKSLEVGQAEFLNQIPEITIRNGSASTDQKQPHFIRRADGTPLAIIDTTGSMNYIEDPAVMALLTESKLIIRRGKNLFNTFDLSGVSDLQINKSIVNSWLHVTKSFISPLSYGIFLMLSYIFAVMSLLLFAIAGLLISSAMKNPLKFKGALRIASVAATPAIIFVSISASLGYHIPVAFYLGITGLYLFIGIKSCSGGAQAADVNAIDLKSFLHEDDISIENAA